MNSRLTYSAIDIAQVLGISARWVRTRAKNEGWRYRAEPRTKGKADQHMYPPEYLPADVQTALLADDPSGAVNLLPVLRPEVALSLIEKDCPAPSFEMVLSGKGHGRSQAWSGERAVGTKVLTDKKAMQKTRILAEVEAMPRGWDQGRRAWIESVALRHRVSWQSIYRWIGEYEKNGLAALTKTNAKKGQAVAWDQEALDYWIGLCLAREHRKTSRRRLYWSALVVEAHRRGWRIGSERSAMDHAQTRVTPQLQALQRGGVRALDNTLPPVIRDYSDLRPFQILVGDQHRFDFWVMDEVSGEIFRPEGYFWQDLRTRLWYGAALARKYDAQLMGLALRLGMIAYGAPESVYTDNGKPEQSNYMISILRDIRSLGIEAGQTEEGNSKSRLWRDNSEEDDLIQPAIRIGHRWAIVKNAKAKMIEGSFSRLEQVLRDAGVPGYVKKLGGSGEENEIDEKEIKRLAESGKLLTFREFVLAAYRAMDYCNREKSHRGALREWTWSPKPKMVRPMDVLLKCYQGGWRPRFVSPEAQDLIFLRRGRRTVDRGRITLHGDLYEHPGLIPLTGRQVDVRWDPYDPTYVVVFLAGEYVCRAEAAEWSSMIDQDKASRLIARKARWRKEQIEEYRRLTSGVADIRQYSSVSGIERAAAVMGREKRARTAAAEESGRIKSDQEIAVEVAKIENYRPRTVRPVFQADSDRYQWCLDELSEGRTIETEDAEFARKFEAAMTSTMRDYWNDYKSIIGLKNIAAGGSS